MKYLRAFWKTISWNVEFRMEYLIRGEKGVPREYWIGYSFTVRFVRNLQMYGDPSWRRGWWG